MQSHSYNALPGRPRPLGATVMDGGVNFVLFSRHASRVWLVVYDESNAQAQEYALDPKTCRVGDLWHVFLEGAKAGLSYAYRLDGPHAPGKGHYFDPEKTVLDPCARLITGNVDDGTAQCIVADNGYDWGDDQPPRTPLTQTIVYEVHVRGFTAHPSSGVQAPGTYRGFINKIPYLQELGITAVEFLPIHHCGERVIDHRTNPETGEILVNYWGYQPIGYFAPDGWYSSEGGKGEQLNEFRDLVRALHAAGIEVIVDVVFNHTAEYGGSGPILCFRGIDNLIYYQLEPNGKYRNLTGCGNTVNCNHPVVRDFILECLRYWVSELHVDGFRFDLACVLNRDRQGTLQALSPLVEHISEDPILQGTKLIAEPWDVGGGYQLGGFDKARWSEWNDRYRDDVRRFWRGDHGVKGDFARRLTGSPDFYQSSGRLPQCSLNFITAHDGFTLRDLVSYNKKHNRANGEDNRDGHGENLSWNCGAEGETDDPIVLALRTRMQRNYLATLMLSLGIPMLLGGDEIGRTQRGNNNAYCQDNDITWINWDLLEGNADLLRFCKALIQFRKDNPVFTRSLFFSGKPASKGQDPDLLWFDARAHGQDWGAQDTSLACRVDGAENNGTVLYLMFNPSASTEEFALPKGTWRMRINTSKLSPHDVPDPATAPVFEGGTHLLLGQRSLVVLDATTPTA